jgi:hypothetical protein
VNREYPSRLVDQKGDAVGEGRWEYEMSINRSETRVMTGGKREYSWGPVRELRAEVPASDLREGIDLEAQYTVKFAAFDKPRTLPVKFTRTHGEVLVIELAPE